MRKARRSFNLVERFLILTQLYSLPITTTLEFCSPCFAALIFLGHSHDFTAADWPSELASVNI
jgi:hypothetical protein